MGPAGRDGSGSASLLLVWFGALLPALSCCRGGVSSDSEEEEEEGAPVQPGKAKRRLKRMMRDTGLADSDDEEEEGEGEEGQQEEGGDSVLVLHMPRLWLKLVATLRLTGCLALPAVPTCLLACQPVADGSGLVPSPGCLPAVSIASCFFMLLPAAADREEESESIMDEEDLDRMAGVAGGAGAAAGEAGAAAREPTPETQLRPAAAVRAACSGRVLLCGTGSGVGHGKGEVCSVVPCLPRAQGLQQNGDLHACLPPVCAAKSLRRAQSGRLPTRSSSAERGSSRR